jgi:hypothetical protein
MASESGAWSKSLKDIPFVDQEFVDNWLKKEDKIPKK